MRGGGPDPRALLLLLLAPLSSLATPAPPALTRAADELAARLAEGSVDRGLLALAVASPGAPGLAPQLETALSGALSRLGFSVAPLRGFQASDPEAAARAMGADRLLRVSCGLVPGRRDLAVSGESIPTRPNFFLQHTPSARPEGARLLQVVVPADGATLFLARSVGPAPRAFAPAVRPFLDLGERVLALAAGDATGDGAAALAVVTPSGLSLYAPTGALLARRRAGPPPLSTRHLAATAAIGNFGGGRIAWQRAGDPRAEVLAFAGGSLAPVASLPAAPLCAGGAGPLFGAFLPGKASLADLLLPALEPAARPRSERELVAAAAAPLPGHLAYAALSASGVLSLLGPDLAPAGAAMEGIGAGLALADLDGDGEPEVVASLAEDSGGDRVRVLRPAAAGQEPAVLFESKPVPGAFVAGAAGDLTGDGVDDAAMAAVLPDGTTRVWLVTADPRFGAGR